jgi:hypothetical protein
LFWTIVDRLANLTFLLLAILLITILLTNSNETAGINNFQEQLDVFKTQILGVQNKTIIYVEGRVNRLQEQQDSYQNSTSSRMDVLERKMQKLEADNKKQLKIINNNNSTAVINSKP